MAPLYPVTRALRGRAWRTAVVALGGNVGDVPRTFVRAIDLLHGGAVQVAALSRLYRSVPLRLPARSQRTPMVPLRGDALYTNAACVLHTLLGPRELLVCLQKIERTLGRRRGSLWAPRTLDLDLITFQGHSMGRKRLTLPHPGIAFRPFVLAPLQDINAQHPWPDSEVSVDDLLRSSGAACWGIVHKQLSWLLK